MAYTLKNMTGFEWNNRGQRIPNQETRATLQSAIKRAGDLLTRLGATEIKETRIGGPAGMVVVSNGGRLKFLVEAAD